MLARALVRAPKLLGNAGFFMSKKNFSQGIQFQSIWDAMSTSEKFGISKSKSEIKSLYHPNDPAYSIFEKMVKFSFVHQGNLVDIEVSKAQIDEALKKPQQLPDGSLSIQLTQKVLNTDLVSSMLFGADYKSRTIALTFNPQQKLKAIEVTEEKMKWEKTVLFSSGVAELAQEQQPALRK